MNKHALCHTHLQYFLVWSLLSDKEYWAKWWQFWFNVLPKFLPAQIFISVLWKTQYIRLSKGLCYTPIFLDRSLNQIWIQTCCFFECTQCCLGNFPPFPKINICGAISWFNAKPKQRKWLSKKCLTYCTKLIESIQNILRKYNFF